MNHAQRLQNAIDFIEKNLANPITLTEVSKAAFSSLSYFHRIFYFTTGWTVKEYIRKRRLSHAAYQLHCTDLSITNIALAAGYETPESFTRAFKQHFGVNPRTFKKASQEFPLFTKINIIEKFSAEPAPKLDFNLILNYVLFKETSVKGFKIHTTLENGQQAVDICNFANQIMASNKLAEYFNLNKTPIFGVYTNMTDESEFDYTIGCLKSSAYKECPKIVTHTLPSSRYAKFTLNRLDRIKEAWHYIYGSWFLKHNSYRTTGFDFEIYYPDAVDIYIPMNDTP